MLVDLTEENILKEFANVPKEVKDALLYAMGVSDDHLELLLIDENNG
ncbi:hypothetical protein SOL01_13950 [Streptococcus cristatus]|uniref:Uncharacterized protein n=1 Tax=Streptococcus cristatus TaxID=45634 RepID=A0A512ACU3_STRCR|nr:hypothetical protein SOL01_13950 [Streptococcus cristatus]